LQNPLTFRAKVFIEVFLPLDTSDKANEPCLPAT
jgi:hypothetical protein